MRTIKTAKVIILSMVTLAAAAQKKTGVYLTYQDYLDKKLSYQTPNCNGILTNEFLNNSFITVKQNANKLKLQKDSIYGIADCKNQLIRFYGKEGYALVEKGAIWIFEKDVVEHYGKAQSTVTKKKYSFSTSGDNKLMELTLDDVKMAFVNNQNVRNLLEVQFKCDKDLTAYDEKKHEYKIDELIETAIK